MTPTPAMQRRLNEVLNATNDDARIARRLHVGGLVAVGKLAGARTKEQHKSTYDYAIGMVTNVDRDLEMAR